MCYVSPEFEVLIFCFEVYPKDIDIPIDSDYDNQEDVEPVITELMPLEKQDPKLCADYIGLPDLPYVLCLCFILFDNLYLYLDTKKCSLSLRVTMEQRNTPLSGEC